MKRQVVRSVVAELLAAQGSFSNRDVAGRAGLTRQAVHAHLRRLVASHELRVEGAGRAVRYRAGQRPIRGPRGPTVRRYRRAGLAEDEVWEEVSLCAGVADALPANARSIMQYAFTEMVNNAIEHSRSPSVEVGLSIEADPVWFEVVDRGVGMFLHVARELGLSGPYEAIEQLAKGKTTTRPDRHTGEGLFFTSRIADVFEVESSGIRWVIDNRRSDQALGSAPARRGTRVRFELDRHKACTLESLFAEFTENFEFTRTSVRVKLFERGVRFISRSEAKRLVATLERFRFVILDFRGVEAVGQGFCDEVFRVWARENPGTRLEPIEMCPPVEMMVRRAMRGSGA